LSDRPRERASTAKLVASRFTSHSKGAGRVSSKSLTSKTGVPSSEAKVPKFARWQSPQDCTQRPLTGVSARSAAMMAAAPRRKVKGEGRIRS